MNFIALIILLLGVDQFTKELISKQLLEGESIKIVGNFLYITYVKNYGIAFGLFQGSIKIVSLIAIIAIFAIGFYMVKKLKKHEVISKYAYAFILAGAIGNMIDRLYRGFVIDFIDFRGIWSYIFNMADVFINIGIILLIFEMIYLNINNKNKK